MARMKGIPSTRLGPVPPSRFGPAPFTNEADRSRWRREVHEWRKWYDEPEWRRLSLITRAKACFVCAMCGAEHSDLTLFCRAMAEEQRLSVVLAKPYLVIRSGYIADHVKPHRGDRSLFFDENNLQCLCKACHDKAKQAEERAAGW
jgi:5-methylcytosine-specific restriction endonuclease McrA